jgi:hypothetical protein
MKKIYYISRLIPVVFLSLFMWSCNEQLNTDDAQKVSSSYLLSSTTGLNMVLNSTYHFLYMANGDYNQTVASYEGLSGYPMLYDIGGSDIICRKNYGGSVEVSYDYDSERTSATVGGKRMWEIMYKVINEANEILNALNTASGTDADKAILRGQALAIRAIAYFELIINYQQTYAIAKSKRGVILRLSPSDPVEKGFSTVEECYAQIVSDLTTAKTDLANYTRPEKWRINTDVVSGVLARVYQIMGNWSDAYKEAKAVYDKYSTLMSKSEWYGGFDDLMANDCKELVWGIKYTDLSNISASIQFCFWYNQDPSYGEAMTGGPVYNFINLLVDQKYVDLFDNTDYRGFRCDKTANVTNADEKAVMFWHRTNNGDPDVSNRWAYNKLKTYGDGNGAIQSHPYGIDFPLMRGSEMLLIMAEAEANMNNTTDALNYLQILQRARNAQVTTDTDKATLLSKIYIERRKELLGEGLTGIYDLLRLQQPLVRYGATATNLAGHLPSGLVNLDGYNGAAAQPMGTIPSNDYRFINQIPELEFTNNSAIDSSKDQNPTSGQ